MTILSFLFDKIEAEEKTVEARIAIPKYTKLKIGDIITFLCATKTVSRKIIGRAMYVTFEQMLKAEGIYNCLPGVKSFNEAAQFYLGLKNYANLERKFGVVAFRLQAQVHFKILNFFLLYVAYI